MNDLIAKDSIESNSLTDKRKLEDEIKTLLETNGSSPNSEQLSRLALAYYRNEKYDLAVSTYEKALQLAPSDTYLKEMWQLAKANDIAGVHVSVPEVYYFDREKLLSQPNVPNGALPKEHNPVVPLSFIKELRLVLGNGLGHISTALMDITTNVWGALAGYTSKVWTNWYRRPLFFGILTLAYMREKMNAHNLVSTYPKGSLVGFLPEGLEPPEEAKYYRTADGSWNNLSNPKEGAAGTRLSRNVELTAIKQERGAQLLTPSPREISRHLLTRGDEMKEVPFLNLLAASWIQFQNSGWINHGENLLTDIIEVPLAEDDPARKKFWQTKMLIPRTQPDPTRTEGKEDAPISFINEVTHWWDGSQIYGSDQETVDRLRSHADGKLKVNPDGTLPLSSKGIEDTGFVRNWWVGMSMLHTLFVREHNSICDRLKASYSNWDDKRLFNVARLINAAVMAKIHSIEWTPAILPNKGLDTALNANWYGILTNLFHAGNNRKTVSDVNVRNPELGGVVGNPINKHNVPYALTQEFVEVYRLHSLLPEKLNIQPINANNKENMEIPFAETRQAGAAKLTKKVSLPQLFYSFGNQHPGQLVLNNYPKFMQELSIPFNPVYDMGAVDILRARERGVPRYNEFRRQLGLKPIEKFEDLTGDADQLKKLKDIYGTDANAVETLDLMVGTLAEGYRPTGFGFGETMFQIFILNATRRLQADRFYTDCYTEEYYTKEGLDWIDRSSLKHVILRHYPELASTGLGNIKNAFEPWDTGEKLDAARHPLRGWDKSFKGDPWTGDAFK